MSLKTRLVLVATIGIVLSGTVFSDQSASGQQGRKPIYEPVHRVGSSGSQPSSTQPTSTQPTSTQPPSALPASNQGTAAVQDRQPDGRQLPPAPNALGAPQNGPGYGASQAVAQLPIQGRPGQHVIPVGATYPLPPEDNPATSAERHPLDPAIQLANRGLNTMRTNIHDYTCHLLKRERINGRLTAQETIFMKVRNERQTETGVVPLSLYMRFVGPRSVAGREVIWVRGWNDNKLVAHDVGWKSVFRANLDPEGMMAMQGNRYPVFEAGIENLVEKLIDVAERDRAAGDCEVEFFQGAEINDRPCTVIQVTHPEQRQPYDFHMARVYIDNELQVPVRYAAYSWPTREGGSPVLEEEYTYLNIKVNCSLTDRDFDPDNPDYDYP